MSENEIKKEDTLKQKSKDLRKKGALLLISIVLVFALVFGASFAWYTKMTSLKGIEFEVAKWEFNASHSEDSFLVDVYTYSTVEEKYAAPGTWGELPMKLSVSQALTDVDYAVMIDKSTMHAEFQRRIYFYYTTEKNAPVKELPDGGVEVDLEKLTEFSDIDYLSGNLERGNTLTVRIYWHWIYDFEEYLTIGDHLEEHYEDLFVNELGVSKQTFTEDKEYIIAKENKAADVEGKVYDTIEKIVEDGAYSHLNDETFKKILDDYYEEKNAEFDEFDTLVGTRTSLYKEYMRATMTITGAESEPLNQQSNS